MPTQEECTEIKITQAQQDAKLNAVHRRLDEVLSEVKELKQWLAKFGTLMVLLAMFGEKAVPILSKLIEVQ